MRSPIASYPPACAASISVIGSVSTTVKWAKERSGMPYPRRGRWPGTGEMLDLAQIGVSAFSRQDFRVEIAAPTWLGDITIVIVIQRRQRYGALCSRENMCTDLLPRPLIGSSEHQV